MPRVVIHQDHLGIVAAAPFPLSGFSNDRRRLSPPNCTKEPAPSACTADVVPSRPSTHQRHLHTGDALIKELSAAMAEYVTSRLICPDQAQARHGAKPVAAPSSFISHAAPPVTLEAYIARIIQWTGSAACVVIAIALLTRIRHMITPLTVHRMLLGAFVLAVKLHEESFHPLAYYALMGGVNVSNLRHMERDTFQVLNFSCLVTAEEFRSVVNDLRRLFPKTKGGRELSATDIPTEVVWDVLLPPMA